MKEEERTAAEKRMRQFIVASEGPERVRREQELQAWYELRKFELANGDFLTGVLDLDFVLRRWPFLSREIRVGIVAMVRAVPLGPVEVLKESMTLKAELWPCVELGDGD